MSTYPFVLWGEVDIASAPKVRIDLSRAIDATGDDVTVDCAHLKFIDSTGVLVLLEAHEALATQDRRLRIVNLASGPRRVFTILDLTKLFDIESLVSS